MATMLHAATSFEMRAQHQIPQHRSFYDFFARVNQSRRNIDNIVYSVPTNYSIVMISNYLQQPSDVPRLIDEADLVVFDVTATSSRRTPLDNTPFQPDMRQIKNMQEKNLFPSWFPEPEEIEGKQRCFIVSHFFF